jgi:hypothetical protein
MRYERKDVIRNTPQAFNKRMRNPSPFFTFSAGTLAQVKMALWLEA